MKLDFAKGSNKSKNERKGAQHDFTEGSIRRKLLLFAFPIMAGLLLQTAFNITDAIFVGMIGPLEIAAISLSFPVMFVLVAIASGLGIGANALISQFIGKKDIHAANNIAEHALVFGAILGIIVGIAGIILSPLVFSLMGADETTLPMAIEYSMPIYWGTIFLFAWFVSDAILKSQGDSKTPMKNLVLSVVLNAILDPLLIFGIGPFPKWGLFGASIATVISRALAAALNFMHIYKKNSAISLSLREFRPRSEYIKKMLLVGFPASLSQMLSAIGFMLITTIVGQFGSYAIAGLGIGLRLNSVMVLPMIGMSSAVVSFVGQNIGKNNFERAKKATMFATKITFGISIALSAIAFFFPEPIIMLFTQSPEVLKIGKEYLSIMPLMFIAYGAYFAIYGAFNGAGKTKFMLFTNIVYWIVAICSAFLLSQTIGLKGIWIGWVLGATVEMILVHAIFRSSIWTKGKKKLKIESAMPL